MNVGDIVKNTNIPSLSSRRLIGVIVAQKQLDDCAEMCKVFWFDTGTISGWFYGSQVELIEEI